MLRVDSFTPVASLVAAAVLQAITFTTVAQGTASRIDEPRQVVVRTAEDFQALWKSHSSAAPPTVDFSKSIVVGVFMGTRTTAGYGIAIGAVKKTDKGAIVEYVESVPDKSKMAAQVLTSPFHLVSIPRDTASVAFQQVQR